MNRAHGDNALLSACDQLHGLVQRVCLSLLGGMAIGTAWYVLVGIRAGH